MTYPRREPCTKCRLLSIQMEEEWECSDCRVDRMKTEWAALTKKHDARSHTFALVEASLIGISFLAWLWCLLRGDS